MYVSFSVETKSFVEAYNTPISWNSNLFLVQSPRNLKFLKNFERIYLFFFSNFLFGYERPSDISSKENGLS